MFRRILFDLWYLLGPPWDTGVSPPELLSFVATHAPGVAIDIGCGSGTNLLTLAQHGWKVTGVDFSPRAIKMARRRMLRAGLTADLLVADVTRDMALPGNYDLALDIGCFHGVRDRSSYLRNLSALLKTHGHWLIYAFVGARSGRSAARLDSKDLHHAESHGFRLLERADGLDRRGRPSAWLLFEKSEPAD